MLFGTIVLSMVVLLGLPMFGHLGKRASAAAAAVPTPSASSDGASQDATGLGPVETITPSASAPASKPAVLAKASPGGVTGPAGDLSALGIPVMVLHAYQLAADTLGQEQPSCHLPWWLLAGIGHTESGHAESGRLYADGTTRGRILGPRLDGRIPGTAVVRDTDHGYYDGDTGYDRAVGPMQFIPSTWARWGADGNHDGKKDPNNIFDATLAAARYLCAGGRNLATLPGQTAAVLSYNDSQAYLQTVLAWGLAYRSGAAALPDENVPVVVDVTKVRPPLSSRPPVHHGPKPSARPTTSRSAPASWPVPTSSAPSAPSSSPSGCPTPTPTPTSGDPSASPALSSPVGTDTTAPSSTGVAQTAAALPSDSGSASASASTSCTP
jgi:membrane-bound lytic murein transglycosylase B